MRKILEIDGIKIAITMKPTGEELGKFYFYSQKYDIWCLDDSWRVAQEDLAWILRDKVEAYISTPYSNMTTKREKRKWKAYRELVDRGLQYHRTI
ncbi:MAG: hypothetical protein NC218_03905 [Acetobacter sp.]|nr:hypothetical protein [Acetobacter sp.]